MTDYYTEDLAEFGARERKLAAELLGAQIPQGFYQSGIKVACNLQSGYVFLVNEDCQCAMINTDSGELEIHHSTPYEGKEGFLTDLLNEYEPSDFHHDDVEYLRHAVENEGLDIGDFPSWNNKDENEEDAA